MTFIFIDRRKSGKGKSVNNRQKLIKRIKSFIKESLPQNIGTSSVSGSNTTNTTSPVVVTSNALEEHFFTYASGYEHTKVFIGNDIYERGDEIEYDESGGSSTAGSPGENGEDDFIVNVAKNEFLDLFFEDCELPNLTHEKLTEKLENTYQQAGFSTTGNPSQLSIIRSYKQSLSRRRALTLPYKKELEELEEELENGSPSDERVLEIQERLVYLKNRINSLNAFDKVDLRYKKHEAKPLKTTESVLILIMDISGSMGQNEKTIARRWFALLYAFIKRRYAETDLIFIAHTSEAMEMSENDFFSTRVNGGTSVSPAIELANKIILERYDPEQTNIYVSHASDGDNWDDDNAAVLDKMTGARGLSSKIQMFSYVEVGRKNSTWMPASSVNSNLWGTYDICRTRMPKDKMVLSIIENADDCYGVFKKVFKKQSVK